MYRRVAALALAAAGLLGSAGIARANPDMVAFAQNYAPGTIVVHTSERRLYLVAGNGYAVRYPVGVGRAGKQWAGVSQIDGKYLNPAWSPPA